MPPSRVRQQFVPAALIALFALPACAPGRRGLPPGAPGIRVEPVPVEERPAPTGREAAVVWTPVTGDDLLLGATFFLQRPGLRASAVLPDLPPEDEKLRQAWPALVELAARDQLEWVMTLPGDPPLALLQDTDIAKDSAGGAASLPPRFAWPDDALGHLALARDEYRRRWRRSPTALVIPGGLLAGPEVVPLQKMGIRWTLLLDGTGEAGCFSGLPVKVARAVPFQAGSPLPGSHEPEVAPPPLRVSTPEQLESLRRITEKGTGEGWRTVTELLDATEKWPVWPGLDREPPDFSPWIGEPEENAAWRLLGMTRQALEEYKNSGDASVKNLDLAQREVYSAESGRYFFYFGADHESYREHELKQEFLATLGQAHRLLGQPVPSYLTEDFSGTPAESAEETGGSVFHRGANSWRWTDPPRDDRGPGDYFYPTGREFLPGSWDLLSFEVRLSEKNVSFYFELASLSNPWRAPHGFSLPLADVYIDINRLPGAGSESLLPGRPGIVESQNAWEYALAVDGWGARFYQFNPRLAARRLEQLPVHLLPQGNGFRVDVPRRHFRGNPDRWGYGVAVMGLNPAAGGSNDRSDPRPMAVVSEPDPRRFGGAWEGTSQAGSGREAPPFIDILVPPGQSQTQTLGLYKQGRDVVLPFVRPQ